LSAVVFHGSIWVLLLPGLLIRDRVGSLSPPWRAPHWVFLGGAVLVIGCWLVWSAAAQLVERGISPFAAHPGPVLVTGGLYARVRNPMDLGATLMSLGPAIAVDVAAVWIVPIAAFIYFAVGRGPLENHYLAERFGEEYEAYRAAVPLWTPRWG
jgi:protein-S-isoprenylcysteine O-methyltransferase Ste14